MIEKGNRDEYEEEFPEDEDEDIEFEDAEDELEMLTNPACIYSEAEVLEGELPAPPKPLQYIIKNHGDIDLTDESKEIIMISEKIKMKRLKEL